MVLEQIRRNFPNTFLFMIKNTYFPIKFSLFFLFFTAIFIIFCSIRSKEVTDGIGTDRAEYNKDSSEEQEKSNSI